MDRVALDRDGPLPRATTDTAPASRVATAATLNDRIEADIQAAGVKPTCLADQSHAETHHEM